MKNDILKKVAKSAVSSLAIGGLFIGSTAICLTLPKSASANEGIDAECQSWANQPRRESNSIAADAGMDTCEHTVSWLWAGIDKRVLNIFESVVVEDRANDVRGWRTVLRAGYSDDEFRTRSTNADGRNAETNWVRP